MCLQWFPFIASGPDRDEVELNICENEHTVAPGHFVDNNSIYLFIQVNKHLIILLSILTLPVDPNTLNVSRSSSPERFLSIMNNL